MDFSQSQFQTSFKVNLFIKNYLALSLKFAAARVVTDI